MITKIGDILREIIPNFEDIEIVYGEHYLHTGYDSKNHMLLIRNCMYCYNGCEVEFDLDTVKVTKALEEKLPLKVEFDKEIIFDKGQTYKFYITLKEEED